MIIAINGSPRVAGNSDVITKELSSVLGANTINLRDLSLTPCSGCGGCDKTGRCILKDDISHLYEQIATAQGLILVSPIYFGSLSAQMKTLIDRGQAAWAAKYLLKEELFTSKIGFFFSVAALKNRDRFFANAQEIVEIWFKCLGVSYHGGCFFPGYEKPGAISQDQGAMEKIRREARKLRF